MSESPYPRESQERRQYIRCVNCGIMMVCMNKYVILKDEKIYLYYICPRRRQGNEKGCGHKTFIEIKRDDIDIEKVELSPGIGMIGHVRITDKVAMIIQDNLETFETWLYKNRDRFKDKQVEITVKVKDENFS